MAAADADHDATDWADVVLVLIQFAREQPGTFLVTVAVLVVFTIVVGLCIWLMLPRIGREVRRTIREVRGPRRRGDEPPSEADDAA
jgi:hypothetical protein